MAEKRFKEVYPDIIRNSYCFTDNGKGISDKEVVDLLNALHEENKQLKSDCDYRWKKYCNTRKEMLHENEQLKRENEQLKLRNKKLLEENYLLKEYVEKENEQLMKENQELRMSPRVDVNEIESLVCENEKLKSENKELKSEITTLKGGYDEYEEIIGELKAENEKLKEENKSWLKTASRMDTIHHEDREYCERIHRENEKLKQENQQYKSLLRDMGLLMSGEDVMAIRNNFADKIIKPIFAESGFDVDVDTSNGFAISLKEEKE